MFKKIKICNGKHECQFKLTLAEYGLNIDQTPTRFVLGSSHIQAQIGSDIGLIARSHDKGMITTIFTITTNGVFSLMQVIYGGKTSKSFCRAKLPEPFTLSENEKHYSNE